MNNCVIPEKQGSLFLEVTPKKVKLKCFFSGFPTNALLANQLRLVALGTEQRHGKAWFYWDHKRQC